MPRVDETRQLTSRQRAQRSRFVERRRLDRAGVPALTLLAHPDSRRVGERAILRELAGGGEVLLSRLQPGFEAPDQPGEQRPLHDPYLSRTPLHLRPGSIPGGLRLQVEAERTQVAVDGRPLVGSRELSRRRVQRGVVLELAGRVVLLLHSVASGSVGSRTRMGLVGDSEAIERVRQEIAKVADLEVPVLLKGETGTGKELVAEAIHRASRRSQQGFLSLNVGAVPAALAAAELFGSVKGAFTGAVRSRIGYFQRAHGGTLFLDEIGEAPPEVQVLLLRALEGGEIQRLGSQEPTRVDVRLIAATDIDLDTAIAEGRFKAPLLHRLSGYEILIPPLRARRDDFGRLLYHFLRQELRALGQEHLLEVSDPAANPWLPASIVARLARHPWPGNVRQLRNVARQLVIGSRGAATARITPQVERLLREAADQPTSPGTGEGPAGAPGRETSPPPSSPPPAAEPGAYRKPSEVTEEELLAALAANRYKIKPTARQLGVSRPSLYLLIDRCPKVRRAADLSREEILAGRGRAGDGLEALAQALAVSAAGLRLRMKQLGIE